MLSVQPGGELRDQAVSPSSGLLTMPSRLPFLDESAPSILADGLLRASNFLQVGTGKLFAELKGPLPFLRKVSFWFSKFRSGDFSLENEPRRRPQPKVNNYELKAIVECDTSQTIRELASKLSISIPTILYHLRQINKVKKFDRWVPNELNAHQMKKRFDACISLLSRNKGEAFLRRIVT